MNLTCAILSFNHPEITSRCVKSVVRYFADNAPQASLKNIILVHNGSRPEHVETLKISWPQIHHLELASNRGFSGGANAATLIGTDLTDPISGSLPHRSYLCRIRPAD